MKTLIASLWVVLCLCTAASATGSPASGLESKFEAARATLQQEKKQQIDTLNEGYLRALARSGTAAQQAGDLDTFLAARDESQRFQASPAIEDAHLVVDEEKIRGMQQSYQRQHTALTDSFALRFGAMYAQYENAMSELQNRLTREKKIDLALEAKEALNRLSLDADYLTAQMRLEDARARQKQAAAAQREREALAALSATPPATEQLLNSDKFDGKDKGRIKDRFQESCTNSCSTTNPRRPSNMWILPTAKNMAT